MNRKSFSGMTRETIIRAGIAGWMLQRFENTGGCWNSWFVITTLTYPVAGKTSAVFQDSLDIRHVSLSVWLLVICYQVRCPLCEHYRWFQRMVTNYQQYTLSLNYPKYRYMHELIPFPYRIVVVVIFRMSYLRKRKVRANGSSQLILMKWSKRSPSINSVETLSSLEGSTYLSKKFPSQSKGLYETKEALQSKEF